MTLAITFVLSTILVSSVFADDIDACVEMFNPDNFGCCESTYNIDNYTADMSECMPESGEATCENFKCLLDKEGAIKDDILDEDVLRSGFDKMATEYPEDKDMIIRMRNECLDGRFNGYPPEDSCPAFKFFVCMIINANLGCQKWKTSDACAKTAENAKKCRALVDK